MHTIVAFGAFLVFSGAAPGSGDAESATPASVEETGWAAALGQGQKSRGQGQESKAKPSDPPKSPAARGGAARDQESRSRAQQGPERSRRNGRAEARGQRPSDPPDARSERRPVSGRPDQARERKEPRERAGERARTRERERPRDRGTDVEPRGRRPELDRSDERRPRRGRVGRARLQQGLRALPPETRRLATSSRRGERLVAGAVAHAVVRGVAPSSLIVRSSNGRVTVLNRNNELLLDLDPRSARELGSWEVRRLGDRRPHAGSPAFCASGAGHPVWGREWCIDKGFGLGGGSVLWSRGTVDDVIFRRRGDRDRVDGGSLEEVLGEIVFNRLALHALALGYDEPIKGLWVADPSGPRLLRVYSGDVPVAELMDADRDDRVEIIYVAQHR